MDNSDIVSLFRGWITNKPTNHAYDIRGISSNFLFPSLFQFYRNVKGYNKKLHDDMYAYFLYSFCHMLLFGPIAVSNFF